MTVIDDRTSGSATVAEVANGLVKKVRAGDNIGAMDTFYHADIISVEAAGEPREVVGIGACKQKGEWWNQSFDVHSSEVEGPFIGGNQFGVRYVYEVTNKGTGQRTTMDELALYWVQDGKIVKEQFFYHAPGM